VKQAIIQFIVTVAIALTVMLLLLGWGALGELKQVVKPALRSLGLIGLALPFSILFTLLSQCFKRTRLLFFLLSTIPAIFLGYLMTEFLQHFWGISYNVDKLHLLKYVPPALALGIGDGFLNEFTQHTQQEFSTVMRENYVKHAKTMGAQVYIEAANDFTNRSLRILLTKTTALISGTVVVEKVFGIKGIGDTVFDAIKFEDAGFLSLILCGIVIVVALFNVVHQIMSLFLDPRLRQGRRNV
jgi:ABC-type dipeptide/oligopeptide/nickel transport system permease component